MSQMYCKSGHLQPCTCSIQPTVRVPNSVELKGLSNAELIQLMDNLNTELATRLAQTYRTTADTRPYVHPTVGASAVPTEEI